MLRFLAFLLLFAQSAAFPVPAPVPATDVKSADIQATLKRLMANPNTAVTDTPLRTVDAGGQNIGIGVVYRPAGAKSVAASHDKVTEVYQVLEGSGTLVTGGRIVNPQRRTSSQKEVTKSTGQE